MVVADVLSSTEAQITPPAVSFVGLHDLTVYSGSRAIFTKTFEALSAAAIQTASPFAVVSKGGEVISIIVHESSVKEASFVFGGVVSVQAVLQSSRLGQWKCNVPAMAVGTTKVQPSYNGQDVGDAAALIVVAAPNVTSVSPVVVTGHREVLVAGSGFSIDRSVLCTVVGASLQGFASAYSLGSIVSSSSVTCTLPSRGDGMQVLEVSQNENDQMMHDGVQLEYVRAPHVQSVHPSTGPISGGTQITMIGGPFIKGSCTCQFPSLAVPAHVISSSVATCVSPSSALGAVAVVVDPMARSIAPASITNSTPQYWFTYQAELQITKVEPHVIPASGRVIVTIDGLAHSNQPHQPVYAWLNGQVFLESQSVSDFSAVFSTSAMKAGNISIEIASQQGSAMYFEMFARTNITVAQQSSFTSGGATITLLGDFALEPRHMLSGVNCAFGIKLAQLQRLTQSATVCTAPSHAAGYTALGVTAGELHQMDEVITESIEFEFLEDLV
jgi:hypothetical protein